MSMPIDTAFKALEASLEAKKRIFKKKDDSMERKAWRALEKWRGITDEKGVWDDLCAITVREAVQNGSTCCHISNAIVGMPEEGFRDAARIVSKVLEDRGFDVAFAYHSPHLLTVDVRWTEAKEG